MKVHIVDTPCNTNRTRRTSHGSRTTKEVTKVTCKVCIQRAFLENAEWVALMVQRGHYTNAEVAA
jgi:hypothetical protein